MEVKVIGPIKDYLKTFNTPDEFNLWYAKNKDDVDKLTTHKLNKMYYIDGFRITKIKGVLCLKKDTRKHVEEAVNDQDQTIQHEEINDINNEIAEHSQSIESIKADIVAIKNAINEIVKAINNG